MGSFDSYVSEDKIKNLESNFYKRKYFKFKEFGSFVYLAKEIQIMPKTSKLNAIT